MRTVVQLVVKVVNVVSGIELVLGALVVRGVELETGETGLEDEPLAVELGEPDADDEGEPLADELDDPEADEEEEPLADELDEPEADDEDEPLADELDVPGDDDDEPLPEELDDPEPEADELLTGDTGDELEPEAEEDDVVVMGAEWVCVIGTVVPLITVEQLVVKVVKEVAGDEVVTGALVTGPEDVELLLTGELLVAGELVVTGPEDVELPLPGVLLVAGALLVAGTEVELALLEAGPVEPAELVVVIGAECVWVMGTVVPLMTVEQFVKKVVKDVSGDEVLAGELVIGAEEVALPLLMGELETGAEDVTLALVDGELDTGAEEVTFALLLGELEAGADEVAFALFVAGPDALDEVVVIGEE